MTNLGFLSRRWLARHKAAIGASALSLAFAAGAGCAQQVSMGTGGTGGAPTTTTTTSSSATSTTTATTTGTTTTTGITTTTTTSSSSGTGGTGGTTTGTGGTGGVFVPPTGTAEYPAEMEPNNDEAQANLLPPAPAKGFTASIWPLGDVDDFKIVVTGGAALSVTTSDGMGGCPSLLVRVSDSMENVLAMDPGDDGCVSLTPANNPALMGLAAGTYYVHVENPDLAIVPVYVVEIDVKEPVCGDGVVQASAGEQCDNGAANGTPNNDCSAACVLTTGDYVNEVEPNDTPSTAQDLDGDTGVVGQINPAGDVDYYEVSVMVADSTLTATIGDGMGGCPVIPGSPGFDPELQLYGPTGTLLITDTNSGVAPCSAIQPSHYSAAAHLPIGKYKLQVSSISMQILPYYVLSVHVAPPGCGDGVIEAPEQCDPGPTMVPGCSATCMFTADYISETEPNGTQATANPLGSHAGFVGAIGSVGDVDFYSFVVPGPSSLVFLQTSDGLGGCPPSFDSLLTFYGPTGTQLAQDDNGGVGLCSQVSPLLYPAAMNLAAGTYAAKVEYKGDNMTCPEYVLAISVRQPGCGDGILEAGEQCDDGPLNGTAGAGCSATCTSNAPWEIRPNNSIATATPQWPGFSTWKGSISPVGYNGYFTFTLATAGSVTLTTHDVDMPNTCTSDTILHLDGPTGTQITFDDDSGPGPGDPVSHGKCSKISNQMLAAGTYYAWVQRFGNSKIIPSYQLDLLVQ